MLLIVLSVCLGGGLLWKLSTKPITDADASASHRAAASGVSPSEVTPGASTRSGRRGSDPNRPQAISTATAKQAAIDIWINALGTVNAANTALVKSRVDGQLTQIYFQEGQLVKQGDVLAQIDARPYQIQVDQMQGQLARDRALLVNAQLDLQRYQDLLNNDAIAKQQVDTQSALVQQYQGNVQADQAQLANAELQLGFTKITAPISGRLGLRQLDAGNMIRASDTNGLVVITQTQPIYVVFSIPAERLSEVAQRLQARQSMAVEAYDKESKKRLALGSLLTLDNQIDINTGTVRLKALFVNTDQVLFPNQFVNVRLRLTTQEKATLIPSAAVQKGSQGNFVYKVEANRTVQLQTVVLGASTTEQGLEWVAIEQGIKPGDVVAIDGLDKLRNGSKVEVIPSSAAASSAAPSTAAASTAVSPKARHQSSSSVMNSQAL